MSRIATRRGVALAATALVGALALAGCSSASGTASTATTATTTSVKGGEDGSTVFKVESDPTLAKQAAAVVSSGTLNIATAAGTPPYEYFQDGTQTLRGADIDLGNAIAAKLGLKTKYTSLDFAGIIPAVQAKRYDMSIAGMGDTPDREKVLDFVDYSTDSNSIVTTSGNPKGISGMESLCGLSVSAVEGSVPLGLLQAQDKKCSKKIDISIMKDNASALLQVENGRADATIYQTGVAGYLIKTDKAAANLAVVSNTEYGKGYNAIGFAKSSSTLRDLVKKALDDLQKDGTYKAIHSTWGLDNNVVDTITVNDGLKYNQPS
jgi:polar amino acid transport system substrate-binding protein